MDEGDYSVDPKVPLGLVGEACYTMIVWSHVQRYVASCSGGAVSALSVAGPLTAVRAASAL